MIENDAFKLLLINLFHLNPDDIANILCTTFNKMMVLLVTLTDKHQACPYCGFTAPKIKEYVTKEITHSALTTQKCIIKYRARRYKCSCCGKTYYEFNPFVFKSQKISILTVHNILKDLKDFNETFTSVARRYHVSPTSVSTIFDNHVDIGRNPLPEIINFENELPKRDNILKKQFDSAVKIIEKLIEAGVDNGEFICEDCEGTARNIMFVLEGLKISAQTIGVTAEAV